MLKALSQIPDFLIVHSHLEVPVGGGPGRHELSAGGGEEAVNISPQLTGLEPTTVQFLPPFSGLGCSNKFNPKVQIRVLQLSRLVSKKNYHILSY